MNKLEGEKMNKLEGECEKCELHPWGAFLNARWRAILWLRDEFDYDDKTIAKKLSMDEMQVYLIRMSEHMPIPVSKYE